MDFLQTMNQSFGADCFERHLEQQVYEAYRVTQAAEVVVGFGLAALKRYSCALLSFPGGKQKFLRGRLCDGRWGTARMGMEKPLFAGNEEIGFLYIGGAAGAIALQEVHCKMVAATIGFLAEEALSPDLQVRTRENLLRFIATNLRIKDLLTYHHSQMVQSYSLFLGALAGLGKTDLHALRCAAMVHDIGKLAVSNEILLKQGTLTAAEHEEIFQHPVYGASYLMNYVEMAGFAPIVLHHHERFDGGGYPGGLVGESIPLLSRLIAIADAFDAMVNQRVYRVPKSADGALIEIEACAGTQFDPELARLFVSGMRARGACQVAKSGVRG